MARHARLDVARLSETIYLIYKMPFYCSCKPLLTSEVWPPETDLTVVCPGFGNLPPLLIEKLSEVNERNGSDLDMFES
ncbi:hypothetical protein OUZ56_018319 [Daphnia magna]|uniref:Uncharacterized protein n=1 Tax=Daphnia magna TaxID=35525 RepID=A0ABQ9Z8I6_9CRUS|nr:hypothetical protein OUZ56_018319 [Daphnia magna]